MTLAIERIQQAYKRLVSSLSMHMRIFLHPALVVMVFLPTLMICLGNFSPAHGEDTPDDAELLRQAQFRFDPIPHEPPSYPENRLTERKIALGKMLFFDPRMSSSQVVSCNTCHNLGLGGVDLNETSLGHRWQSSSRNAPTVLNSVFNIAQFWDGRARDLAEQAGGPLLGLVEMASSNLHVCKVLSSIPAYVKAFDEAFPNQAEPICFGNAKMALEAFEITLLTPDAPFDRFLRGDLKALDNTTKKGLHLFINKGCADCHMSTNIGGNGYYVFGVKNKPDPRYLPPDDHGCRTISPTIEEDYVFKAPSLRNVGITAPYFHSGSAWTLAEAVKVMTRTQLGIDLDKQEIGAIVAFLQALSGRQPEIAYPVLPASTALTPHPEK
ncbi:MAG: cytochrome-c peroxidase [Desulfocapsaceae bacterium]|nr:cytochrome-c peroxidase [Desulfocapsaceae bacterium]